MQLFTKRKSHVGGGFPIATNTQCDAMRCASDEALTDTGGISQTQTNPNKPIQTHTSSSGTVPRDCAVALQAVR